MQCRRMGAEGFGQGDCVDEALGEKEQRKASVDCHGFRRERKGIKQRARHAQFGGTAAAHDRDLAKELCEQHVLATEDIMFARLCM